MGLCSTFHEHNIPSVGRPWVTWRDLSPISRRLLRRGPILNRDISIVCLNSRWRMEGLSSDRLIVIEIRRFRFISVRPMWPCPLHIFSCLLLGVRHRVWHINDLYPVAYTLPRGDGLRNCYNHSSDHLTNTNLEHATSHKNDGTLSYLHSR